MGVRRLCKAAAPPTLPSLVSSFFRLTWLIVNFLFTFLFEGEGRWSLWVGRLLGVGSRAPRGPGGWGSVGVGAQSSCAGLCRGSLLAGASSFLKGVCDGGPQEATVPDGHTSNRLESRRSGGGEVARNSQLGGSETSQLRARGREGGQETRLGGGRAGSAPLQGWRQQALQARGPVVGGRVAPVRGEEKDVAAVTRGGEGCWEEQLEVSS